MLIILEEFFFSFYIMYSSHIYRNSYINPIMNENSSIYFQAFNLFHLKNSYQKYSLKNYSMQTQHTDF